MKFSLSSLCDEKNGYAQLIDLHSKILDTHFDQIIIDMKHVSWFDANMCAVLGAILYKSSHRNNNTNRLVDIQPRVKGVLAKNGFSNHYGESPTGDYWNTTIAYRRFDSDPTIGSHEGASASQFSGTAVLQFREYARTELLRNPEINNLDPLILLHLKRSIFEMFDNAAVHSNTREGIFSCGQYYHKKGRFSFTVADLGIGIDESLRKHLNIKLSPEKAISWALQTGATTKLRSHDRMGGSGLSIIREFIESNGGCVRIISNKGYCEVVDGNCNQDSLSEAFPGTVVSITINPKMDSRGTQVGDDFNPF